MSEDTYRMVKAACLCVWLIVAAAAVARGIELANELDIRWAGLAEKTYLTLSSLQTALGDVHAIETDTQRTEAEMAGLLNQTRHSMMTPAQTKELVDRAANLMDNANLATIRLGEAADSLRGIAPTMQGAIQQVAADTHNTMEGVQLITKAASDDLSDPAIKESLESLAATSTSTKETAAHLDASAADLQKVADEWAAPVKGFWNHIKVFLFEAAGPLASVATAIK